MQSIPPDNKGLYLRLLDLVRPYSRFFALAVFFLIIFSSTQAAIPALLQPLLDGTFVHRDERFLLWAPLGIIILSLVRGTSNFISQYLFSWISTKVVHDIRDQIFNRYLTLPTHFYDTHTAGSLISKITYDATRVSDSGTTVLISLIKDSFTAAGLIAYIVYLNWKLSFLIFILALIVAYLIKVLGKRLRQLHRKLQKDYSDMTHVLEEAIKGNKVIKIFGGQAKENKRFTQSSNWVRRMQMKTQVASSIGSPIIEIIGAIIMAFIIYISAKPGDDALTVGGFMAFLTALVLLISPIKNLTKINDQIQKGIAAAESLFSIIDEQAEPDLGTISSGKLTGKIQFHNVTFYYPGTQQRIFDNLSLEIPAGSSLALVGASGSGKSTIANLIPRFYTLTSGFITVDGIDITSIHLAEYRDNISYVSQDITLFNDSIANNIAYGLPERPEDSAIIAAARAAYAIDFIEQLPSGFETLIGDNGLRLSGGQRQRIAIARALLKDAPILILDEATSALDTESERFVQAALENLRRNRTTIIIAHRLSTVESADRILVLDRGKIIESGSHADLLHQNGCYASLYKTQDVQG
ncbi:MAG: lipid A export permease/ATP-binding protein MsbA [Gammaproteobacteria bacterium]|nr:lipid A export permease/ATP-binding protein MsbA [Gammaproteobacteria bacterium]MBU1656279.1 lipid A export permease/ATP-binding protein MsbA [Gammaproteobacteria bacterium]MBU1959844.1 lipid A export permease/ATP-binding protein MsbA [Gammaproteobacteria bacterium]